METSDLSSHIPYKENVLCDSAPVVYQNVFEDRYITDWV